MKIGTNTTPGSPFTITETPMCKEERIEESGAAPKMNMEAMEKCQESDCMCADVLSDDAMDADPGTENALYDMPEQMDSELEAELPDSEEKPSDNNLSIIEENALANSEAIVGTGDRAWYLAMVAAGGIPKQDLHPNEVFGAKLEDKKAVTGAGKI